MEKTIEIIYDVADIPGVNPHDDYSLSALDLRDEAMDFIEQVLAIDIVLFLRTFVLTA